MRVVLASVSPRAGRSKLAAFDTLTDEYLARFSSGAGRWMNASSRVFPSEAALLAAAKGSGKPPMLVLLDSRGKNMSSEQLAAWLGRKRDSGTQEIWLAVGPADGWSAQSRQAADFEISLGPMTLAHELARVVMAEQLYRAWAILEGHPYHKGHGGEGNE